MNIVVAKNWRELNHWQLQEIANIYLQTNPEKFYQDFRKMVFVLFQKKKSFWAKLKFYKILRQVKFEDLAFHAQFILETTDFHSFPEIKGLIKPSDRIASLDAKHFSYCDKLYHDWEQDKSEINLRRFVASLYKVEENFDELKMPEVAKYTQKLTVKECMVIALAYKFSKIHIWKTYPVIFPTKKEEDETETFKPVFKKANTYQSFDKVINGLVFTEEKPLGTKAEAERTRIYPFLNVLQESILRNKEKQKL